MLDLTSQDNQPIQEIEAEARATSLEIGTIIHVIGTTTMAQNDCMSMLQHERTN